MLTFIWGLAAGLAAECLIHFLIDRLSRKAAAACIYDCAKCKAKNNQCIGAYCYNGRRKAGITEGE